MFRPSCKYDQRLIRQQASKKLLVTPTTGGKITDLDVQVDSHAPAVSALQINMLTARCGPCRAAVKAIGQVEKRR